jgi:hypothetical protein
MALMVQIKEAGSSFVVVVEDENNPSVNRSLMTARYSTSKAAGLHDREETLIAVRAYAHGVSDGMNTMRSMMPVAHWSGHIEDEDKNRG